MSYFVTDKEIDELSKKVVSELYNNKDKYFTEEIKKYINENIYNNIVNDNISDDNISNNNISTTRFSKSFNIISIILTFSEK